MYDLHLRVYILQTKPYFPENKKKLFRRELLKNVKIV